MSGNLVNAFGKIALDETSRDVRETLALILIELRIMNEHTARMRGEHIDQEDLDDEDLTS